MPSHFNRKISAAQVDDARPDTQASSAPVPRSSVTQRRILLQTAIKGALGAFVSSAAMEVLAPGSASAQTTLTPEMALAELVAGNKRFVREKLTSFQQNLSIIRNHTSEKQQPFAAVLACADSRVPVELVFDQTIGQIFVTRNAGNLAASEIIASLEYGAAVLGVKVIVVMGHGSCGAVDAAIAGNDVPGQISALFPHIRPAIDIAGQDRESVTKANARIQAALLREASTAISKLVKDSKLLVVPAFYNIASGVVSLLE